VGREGDCGSVLPRHVVENCITSCCWHECSVYEPPPEKPQEAEQFIVCSGWLQWRMDALIMMEDVRLVTGSRRILSMRGDECIAGETDGVREAWYGASPASYWRAWRYFLRDHRRSHLVA
jgi:hypothetical protein